MELLKEVGFRLGILHRPASGKIDYTAKPCGEVDYDALCDEVEATYPKILKRLAE